MGLKAFVPILLVVHPRPTLQHDRLETLARDAQQHETT
jgi:hypothetical protein